MIRIFVGSTCKQCSFHLVPHFEGWSAGVTVTSVLGNLVKHFRCHWEFISGEFHEAFPIVLTVGGLKFNLAIRGSSPFLFCLVIWRDF